MNTNYGQPFIPAYATAPCAAAYGPPAYSPPAYPLAALTGQMAPAPVVAPVVAPGAAPTGVMAITSPEWWKGTTYNIPRWALAGGAASLALIAYLWSRGTFEMKRTSTTTRAGAARDFALDHRRGKRRSTRKASRSRSKTTSTNRRRSGGRRRDPALMFGGGNGGARTGASARRSPSASRRRDFGFDLDFSI